MGVAVKQKLHMQGDRHSRRLGQSSGREHVSSSAASRDAPPYALLKQHPLRLRRRPGPPAQDQLPSIDQELQDAQRVLELREQGVLPSSSPPPLTVPLSASGKPLRRLSADDERILAERIQTWGDIDARNALIMANVGLVHLVANQLRRPTIRYEDLIQEGMLGLIRATETFEPHRNIRFSTYCVYWIRAKMQRLVQKLNRDDVPAITGAGMETSDDGKRRRPRARSISLDAPFDDEGDRSQSSFLADDGVSPEEASVQHERDAAVTRVLGEIVAEIGDPRLSTIVERRLLADEPETLSVLGDRLHLSREGARLLENKVLKIAKKRLEEFRAEV